MTFDFDVPVNRRGTHSLKWDVPEQELPMWVADMDFRTAPVVTEALERRVANGVFGYSVVPEEWYGAYIGWWKRRHGFTMRPEWLIFCTGVVPAITCAVKRLTNIGDYVLVQTPVYDIFFHSIENGGRHVLENRLVYDGESYEIDFADLEEKLSHPQTSLMILCNPHNPVGKIWSREELARIGELCKKHHVTVLSDEIHCDLTLPGTGYVPFASVSEACAENSVTCLAASKAFNLAGLQSAAVVVPEEGLRQKMNRGLNSDEIAEPGCFAIDGVVAAFNKGEEWLDSLREYLFANKRFAVEYLKKNHPMLRCVASEATYLLWVDCSAYTDDAERFCERLRKEHGLFITGGGQYRGNGSAFVRINLACPRSQVEEGLRRFSAGLNACFPLV